MHEAGSLAVSVAAHCREAEVTPEDLQLGDSLRGDDIARRDENRPDRADLRRAHVKGAVPRFAHRRDRRVCRGDDDVNVFGILEIRLLGTKSNDVVYLLIGEVLNLLIDKYPRGLTSDREDAVALAAALQDRSLFIGGGIGRMKRDDVCALVLVELIDIGERDRFLLLFVPRERCSGARLGI